MPNLWTHAWMGKAVIGNQDMSTIEEKYFYLGTLGPDFFYYYHVFPWQSIRDKEQVLALGDKLHNESINLFFDYMIGKKEDRCYQAYIKGLLCHFALDSTTHPFVYFYTGDAKSIESQYQHRKMESRIDSLIFQSDNQFIPYQFPYEVIRTTQKERSNLWQWYQEPLSVIYQCTISYEDFSSCWKDCYRLYRLVNDPTGKLDRLLESIEVNLSCMLDVRSVTIPQSSFYDDDDVLNLSHEKWYHPVTKEESTKSFIDLLSESIQFGKRLVQQVEAYFIGEIDKTSLLALIGDRSYDTGLLTTQSMQFFKDDREK